MTHPLPELPEGGAFPRRATRAIRVGSVAIGGGAPVSVQSMTNTDTRNVPATLAQIQELAAAGCEIVRCAVPDAAAVAGLRALVAASPLPVIADIHFDYKLALAALAAGAAGVRVNPGNLGGRAKLAAVAQAAARAGAAVRIGVNGGSLEKRLLAKHGGATAAALVESAAASCAVAADAGCANLKVSLKSSSVPATVAACRLFAARCDWPQHIGITEAGTFLGGAIKSAAGLGCLLLEGIGDTLRVSLTAPPAEEARVGIRILEACGLRQAQPELVSCPTCGRTQIALQPLAEAVEREIDRLKAAGWRFKLRKVAIMGCVVNGPGEARDADLGIAGGAGRGVLFKHGQVVATLPEAELLPALLRELRAAAVPP
ncbi:MAG: flavodoxin-dependent (E)-4-hydroxy-3-methylbut-2-enyl-diphosphate synthase [Lentisphaeria bacterium]|jgi:(E)-4-hydroxy-3-methylbut-2-enyl-diphosphate synthase